MNVEIVRPSSNSTHSVGFWNIGWLTGRNGALKSTDAKKLVSRFMRYLTRLIFYNLHCSRASLTHWISFLGKSSKEGAKKCYNGVSYRTKSVLEKRQERYEDSTLDI